MRYALILLAALVGLMTVVGLNAVAQAQQPRCSPYDAMVQWLTELGERPHARMFSPRGFLLELWGNEDERSWTLIAINPLGRACVADAGGSFSALSEDDAPVVGDPT